MSAPLDRKALAYALSTHLCYSGIQPEDKAVDVLLRRYESYTPEREQQRQDDLAAARAEYEANR
jgi:hypothetical protein